LKESRVIEALVEYMNKQN